MVWIILEISSLLLNAMKPVLTLLFSNINDNYDGGDTTKNYRLRAAVKEVTGYYRRVVFISVIYLGFLICYQLLLSPRLLSLPSPTAIIIVHLAGLYFCRVHHSKGCSNYRTAQDRHRTGGHHVR